MRSCAALFRWLLPALLLLAAWPASADEPETLAHPWVVLPPHRDPVAYFTNVRDGDVVQAPFVLRFGLSNDLILRIALGRNLARPGTWDLRTRADWSVTGNSLGATTGNPNLKPAISDNLDLSLEWYFGGSHVGSLTFNLFAKNIHNFFFQNVFEDKYTFNGVTQNVIVRRPDN